MVKIIIYLLISIFMTFPIYPQWISQNSGTSEKLLTCFFLNSNLGWSAGNNGTILKTTDSGNEWTITQINTQDDIHSIYFIDSLNGWAVLYEYDPDRHGSIIHTTDGGSNWIEQYTVSGVVLHDVYFTDINHGYVVGSSGFIYETNNGGEQWFSVSPVSGYWLYSCYFFNSDIGWVGGGLDGYLLRTIDGGQNWSFISIPTNERMMSIYYTNNNYGWACGAGGKVIRTTNGGLDWSLGNSGVNIELRDIIFIDQNEGWSVGLNGRIIHSLDGGANWNIQNSGLNSHLYGVYFADALTGWAVGDNGTILKTENGGTPVELVSFSANYINGVVKLNWITASELNNSGFEVERKSEYTQWKEIGFVKGSGTTTETKTYSFSDHLSGVNENKLFYRLKQIDYDGSYKYSNEISVKINNTPASFELSQNYPNPFNPTTTIKYKVPIDAYVILKIYDEVGNEIATLINKRQLAGEYNIVFDAKDLSSGIYYYKLNADEYIAIKKLVLIK